MENYELESYNNIKKPSVDGIGRPLNSSPLSEAWELEDFAQKYLRYH